MISISTRARSVAALATLAALACTDIRDPASSAGSVPALASLAVGASRSEADTTARILVTATVTGSSVGERPVVHFTTTGGGFVADGKVQSTLQVMVDEAHAARALLRPPSGAALVLIRASVGTSDRQDSVRFVVTGLQELQPASRIATADGASILALRARVSPTAVGPNRQVGFGVTGGLLLGIGSGGLVTADTGHVAIALLQVPRTDGVIYVQATAGGVTMRDSIVLQRAFPEHIEVAAPPVLVTDQSSALTVAARVSRSTGMMDPRTLVRFSIRRADGSNDSTVVLPARVDDDGRVTATLKGPDVGYSGPLLITATTDGEAGALKAQATVIVNPK